MQICGSVALDPKSPRLHATGMRKIIVSVLIAMLVSSSGFGGAVSAHDFTFGDIYIDHPVARATTSMGRASGGFMEITNLGKTADRLISASSSFAVRTELHLTANDDGVMRMREIEGIEIPAGETVVLKPGSFHVMFIGLDAPLVVGETRELILGFETAGEVLVTLQVEALTNVQGHDMHHGSHNGHGSHGSMKHH